MITPMKKISILCLKADSAQTLNHLRALGVLHVVPAKEPSGETLQESTARVSSARAALDTLHAFEKPFHHECPPECHDADALIEKVNGLQTRRTHLEEQLATRRHTRHVLQPFGSFAPDTIVDLEKRGIHVRLYHVRDLAALEIPDGVQVQELSRDNKGAHIVAFTDKDFSLEASAVHLPDRSLTEIEAEIAEYEHQVREINETLHALTPCKPTVNDALRQRQDVERFAEVHDTMGEEDRLAWLSGFIPADAVERLRNAAADYGWGLKIEDPGENDAVPTLLTLPAWVKPIQAVLQMLAILPGYRESDISGLFLVFFSIFFAILIGDAGYGILFLLATLIARYKKPKAPAYPFVLFGILSTCTIIWGTLTGNYFGIAPDALPRILKTVQISAITGDTQTVQNNIMTICFLIGAIHLTIAHLWNAIALAPALKSLAQIGWIGLVWSMFMAALNMVLDNPYPAWFLPVFIASLALILLFMTSRKDMKKDWIHHAMFPLSVVNCFVDIVSYIRLFAVGMASVSVARSFNEMAANIGISQIWTLPVFALILLLGHGLNIILCALGILVHGVRLNTLEFSLHKNIEWKGVPYRPFTPLAHETVK